ncbi:hypothetical protein [Candidatus Sororendozoicomonas aggregata]|uniref:hypothetical protein n=1 Tax=Candidatus Sororendozoicomonas aggregata TaxID=3073239 RepID=UPI002ECFE04B
MGLLYAFAAIALQAVFWGFIAWVGYIEGAVMAIGVAAPFVVIYTLVSRQLAVEDQLPDRAYDPTLNAFQQPLAHGCYSKPSESPLRRKLPG